MTAAIATENLTRSFRGRRAVDGVSMTVPEGAVYGFLGRNGAGKTTTLKMLLGLLKPDAGMVRIGGIDVAKDRIGAARRVGALLEAHGLYGNLSGRENLALTRRLLGLDAAEVERVLDIVGMVEHGGRRVSEYSLGMRQRLGLARAMLGAPKVLVLDEPTNGLDPDGIADMRQFLSSLPERTGATVLLSSHLLSEIELIADHVGILHAGRLVMEGDLALLKTRQAVQIRVETHDTGGAMVLAASRGFDVVEGAGQIVARLKAGDDARQASAALNRALVEAGFPVFAVTPVVPTLEGLYREAVGAAPAQLEAA